MLKNTTLKNISIVFDDMIDDMLSNKKLNPTVTELFIRNRKLNISIVFITQSYFILQNFTVPILLRTISL